MVTSVRITGITADAIPATKADGSDWDNAVGGGGPDVYVRVRLDGVEVRSTRNDEYSDLDQDELPAMLDLGDPIELNQLARALSFQVVDRDGGAATADDVMGTTGQVSLQSLADDNTRVRSFTSTEGVNLRVTFTYN